MLRSTKSHKLQLINDNTAFNLENRKLLGYGYCKFILNVKNVNIMIPTDSKQTYWMKYYKNIILHI